jgi:hypothetical protein
MDDDIVVAAGTEQSGGSSQPRLRDTLDSFDACPACGLTWGGHSIAEKDECESDPNAAVHRCVEDGWNFKCSVDDEPWPCGFVRSVRALVKRVNGA